MKIKAAIIGSGNIGTDLLYKARRSEWIEPVWMVGIDPASEGLKRAEGMGLKTTANGVDGLVPHVTADGVRIAFDATSASAHADNARQYHISGEPVGKGQRQNPGQPVVADPEDGEDDPDGGNAERQHQQSVDQTNEMSQTLSALRAEPMAPRVKPQ